MVDALGTMRQILELCHLTTGAAELQSVLSVAQDMIAKANSTSIRNSPAPCVATTVTNNQLTLHTLYVGLCDFDAALVRIVGPFEEIMAGNYRTEEDGQLIKERMSELKQISSARNAFAHN